jgi:hypothetical protein
MNDGNVLPVIQIPISLRKLRTEIYSMAREEQVILWLDGEGVAHECGGVDGQGAGHASGDTVQKHNSCQDFSSASIEKVRVFFFSRTFQDPSSCP